MSRGTFALAICVLTGLFGVALSRLSPAWAALDVGIAWSWTAHWLDGRIYLLGLTLGQLRAAHPAPRLGLARSIAVAGNLLMALGVVLLFR